MKNQFSKSIIAVVLLTVMFIVAQSVIATGGSASMGGLFLNGIGTVEQFQLSPADEGYSPSNEGAQFRVHGETILSGTVINEDARFLGYYNSADPSDPLNAYTPTRTLNVGYDSISDAPDLAQLQVNGTIKVTDLADPSKPGLYCLCANGYGVLERCGVYDPAIGETCEGAL